LSRRRSDSASGVNDSGDRSPLAAARQCILRQRPLRRLHRRHRRRERKLEQRRAMCVGGGRGDSGGARTGGCCAGARHVTVHKAALTSVIVARNAAAASFERRTRSGQRLVQQLNARRMGVRHILWRIAECLQWCALGGAAAAAAASASSSARQSARFRPCMKHSQL
jgi:hypothetical protein